jgi:inosine/xanthosine triphosphate pyrophosphatase family protein
MMPPRLLLGTTNPSKVDRLRDLLNGLDLAVVTPDGPAPPIQEGTRSLRDNAMRKATAWACARRLPTIATDGGLSVPGLGRRWRPVLTRRAAGESAPSEVHASHLLALMADLDGRARRAYQREAIVLVSADGHRVGAWASRGAPVLVARAYDARAVTSGFWLPGVLEFEDGRRYGDLSAAERAATDDHWLKLRDALRAAVVAHLGLVGEPQLVAL